MVERDWISQVIDLREGQARQTELRSALADFILVNHYGIPDIEGSDKQEQNYKDGVLYDFAHFSKPYYAWAMLSHIQLGVLAPTDVGCSNTEIKLSSSAFPVDDSRIEDVVFVFEFPELDLRCRLGTESRAELTGVESLSRVKEPFTRHTQIGSRVRSWSKWERGIAGTDINEILTILKRKDLQVIPTERKVLREYSRY